MGSGGKAAVEARRLRELLEKAKQFARECYRGPEAIDVNTEILDMDPNQVGSYTRRGTCHLASGSITTGERGALENGAGSQSGMVAGRNGLYRGRTRHDRCRDEITTPSRLRTCAVA